METSWHTKLIHPERGAPAGFRSLAVPTYRGSTTLFESASDVTDNWRTDQAPYSYGLYGTPTTLELAARIAELEHGYRTLITPGGQAAIALVYFGLVRSGDHVLVPDSVYGPHRKLAEGLLRPLGIAVDCYDPLAGAGISAQMRPNTRLVWCESPGSVTMEVQDVPAIAAAAHAGGALVALDNTYAAGVLFDAFAHGVDVTMQALTKYVGGHSDLILGSVTVRRREEYEAIGNAHHLLGMGASPDDCSLALRGMQTLAVRLSHLERSTLEVARWLETQPEVERVLHPALPSCPGHDTWKRDFTGSASVFSIVLRPPVSREDVVQFVDALRLFEVGYSWGGVTSLAVPHFDLPRNLHSYGDRLVRLNVGLEDPRDLVADVRAGLDRLRAPSG